MSNRIKNHENESNQTPSPQRRGMLIVISSPSGGGKGTLIREVLKYVPDVRYSVSYTTRSPRKGEEDGRDYFFVSVPYFLAMRDAGKFLEWAYVHGTLYGTEREWVEKEEAKGHDIILELDVKGAENVRAQVKDSVLIFVLPPSFEVLRHRLKARGSEKPDDFAIRLGNARHEVESYKVFDYVIINDDADRASRQLASVIYAERARCSRQREAAEAVLDTFAPTVDNDTIV